MSNEELIIRRQFGIPIRTRIYQTAGIFIVGIGVLWGITTIPWAKEYIIHPLTLGTAWLVNAILQILGEPVFQEGFFVRSNFVNLEISATSTGIYQFIILSVGIVAWSGELRKSWRGVSLGIFILMVANLLRTISIYYSIRLIPDWVPFLQGVFWEGVMVLLVPLFWIFWIYRNERQPARTLLPSSS